MLFFFFHNLVEETYCIRLLYTSYIIYKYCRVCESLLTFHWVGCLFVIMNMGSVVYFSRTCRHLSAAIKTQQTVWKTLTHWFDWQTHWFFFFLSFSYSSWLHSYTLWFCPMALYKIFQWWHQWFYVFCSRSYSFPAIRPALVQSFLSVGSFGSDLENVMLWQGLGVFHFSLPTSDVFPVQAVSFGETLKERMIHIYR